jgi:hypothetical protein
MVALQYEVGEHFMILRTSLLLLCLTSAASAQQRLAVDVAIEFIIGNCYHTLDDVSRVESAARLMKWEMLPAEASNMLKPVEGSGSALWHAQYEGQHFLVGVNHGMFEGRPAEVCSVVANLRPD